MRNTHIEWCDHTFNPWEGCTKVSPACAHCYAEARNLRFSAGANWGPGAPRRRTSAANWRQPAKWNAAENRMVDHETFVTSHRPRVFCASLADWLDDEVPAEWLSDLLWIIWRTPNLDWLLLTKRPQNWLRRLQAVAAHDDCGGQCAAAWLDRRPPTNVWVGATVETQPYAHQRIPHLLSIPGRIHFLSCEPLLGPLDLTPWLERQAIHWVITGGESGPHARPMHPAWPRALRDQCAATQTPFLFKQWGEHQEGILLGKKAAGRHLDGHLHHTFPTPTPPPAPPVQIATLR